MQTNYPLLAHYRSKVLFQTALLTIVLLLTTTISSAQITYYNFSESTTTYTPLTAATVIATPTALTNNGSIDSQVYPTVANTIPFNFTYDNASYTDVNIYADGYISFGSLATYDVTPISSTKAYNGVIAAMTVDLHALYNINGLTGNISYETVGTAPNREFVIQWTHFRPYSSSISTTTYWDYNFQIRLKEDNTISIVYNVEITGTPTSATVQTGLRGATNSQYNNRTSLGVSASNWTNHTAGTANDNRMTVNSTARPTAGQTFTWTPPATCVAPPAQPTALTLNAAGTSVTGNFTATAADKYLIVRTTADTEAGIPVDGTTYTTGTGLNGTIVAANNLLTFTNGSLIGNTAYTYTIYAFNSICSGGPLYNTTNPLTANTISCPVAPTALIASNNTLTSFDLNWTAANNGSALPFTYTIEVATNATFTTPIPASPFSVPSNQTSYTITGLTNSTKYYYRIAAVASCSSSYTTVANISTTCQAISNLPYTEGFNDSTLPACWSTTLLSGTTTWVTGTNNDGVPSPKSGTRFASKTYTNSNALLVSPTFNISPQTAPVSISVWIYRNLAHGDPSDVIKFHVNTTASLTTATELLSVPLKASTAPAVQTSGWYLYEATIPTNFNAAPFYIIAQGTTAGNNNSYGLGFDDFSIQTIPVDTTPVSVAITTANNTAATITVNEGTLQLQAAITPSAASQNVTWSITTGTGTANITPTGIVKAITNGTVTAKATSVENPNLFSELEINISNQFPVTSITVLPTGNAEPEITINEGTLQLQATVEITGSNQAVIWTISGGTGQATISANGLITAINNGEVIARATSVSNTAIFGELTITLSSQIPICTPSFEEGTEPITLVTFGGFSNTSPASTTAPSYENFTSIIGNVTQGDAAPIIVKGNTNGDFINYFRVFVDWNHNGIFETEESTDLSYIEDSTGTDETQLTATVIVPTTAFVGSVRMRVMKIFAIQSIEPCNTTSYGQAEDYTINVAELPLGTGHLDTAAFTIYPNPTSGVVTIDSLSEISSVNTYNQLGQLIAQTSNKHLDLSSQASGIYFINIHFADGKTATSKIIKK